MAEDKGIDVTQIANYDFDAVEAETGGNVAATAYREAPPADHEMEIESARMLENQECRDGDAVYILNKVKLQMRVVPGKPFAGRCQTDFIPIPTPGQPWPVKFKERWWNLLRGFGWKVTADRHTPAGFQLDHLVGKRSIVSTVHRFRDKTQQFKDNGEPYVDVRYFGYTPVAEWKDPPSTAPTGNGGKPTASPKTAPKPSAKPAAEPAMAGAADGDNWQL